MSDSLFRLRGVSVRFGAVTALDSLDLDVKPGRIGLLGPNGAGKTTLMRLLLGLQRASEGDAEVLGAAVGSRGLEGRADIGFMPDGDAVPVDETAVAFVTMAAELCGMARSEAQARAHDVLQHVGLGEARYRKLGGYSTGMRQRVRLAQALVGAPKLLLLDEPTSGLDPRGRDEMLALVSRIPEETGSSLVLSTHILPDVEKTCDSVVALADGKVVFSGTLDELVSGGDRTFELRTRDALSDAGTAALKGAGIEVGEAGGHPTVALPKDLEPGAVIAMLRTTGDQVRTLRPLRHRISAALVDRMRA